MVLQMLALPSVQQGPVIKSDERWSPKIFRKLQDPHLRLIENNLVEIAALAIIFRILISTAVHTQSPPCFIFKHNGLRLAKSHVYALAKGKNTGGCIYHHIILDGNILSSLSNFAD